jgi:DNA polymerase IV
LKRFSAVVPAVIPSIIAIQSKRIRSLHQNQLHLPWRLAVVHIDMDAFYASVEQRDDPQLRGKPVIVAWRGKRSVVCAASYEARRFGVRSAMPTVRAERLCTEALFVAPDFPRYRAVSRMAQEIFRRHTDLVEPLSLDEAYLDVTENKMGLPTAIRTGEMLRVDAWRATKAASRPSQSKRV